MLHDYGKVFVINHERQGYNIILSKCREIVTAFLKIKPRIPLAFKAEPLTPRMWCPMKRFPASILSISFRIFGGRAGKEAF